MPQIQPVAVFSRSATFEVELGDNSVYYSAEAYDIYLNGEHVCTQDVNVFTLFGLRPHMLYEILARPQNGGEALRHSFVTKQESIFLDVTRFGAIGDGVHDCTGAIQAALDACAPGGTVYVPAGVYMLYPVFLQSNVTLYLEKDAVLLGGTQRERYPILPGMVVGEEEGCETSFASWEGNPLDSYAALVTALDKHNVVIAGQGTIDANAQNAGWWENPKVKQTAWRPRTVFCARCNSFTLQGITVQNSPSWTVHPYYSRGVDVLNLYIHNPPDSPNTDGCNPESCTDVRVIGTRISVGDDCISVKSGKYYMSQRHPARARNILVRNCLLQRGHGAVVVGSEISSGLDGLKVERCLIQHTDRGLRVKTRRGRGERSVLNNIEFSHVLMQHVQSAFVVNMFYNCDPDGSSEYVSSKQPLPVDEKTPCIQGLYCHDVRCEEVSVAGVYVYGLPEQPIQSLRLRNVDIGFASQAEPGLPAMMEGVEPVKKLALFAANLTSLWLEKVHFTGNEGKRLNLSNVGELVEE